MERVSFSEQIEFLLFVGAIEGESVMTLHDLLKSYMQGSISAEEMQYEINSFNPDFYLEMLQNE